MLGKNQQKGFSLLEIMIALLVFSFGLLGMAAMQAVALSSNQEAQFRIQALAIAEDLASKMRTNRAYINASRYKYTDIPASHLGYNVYSEFDYNTSTSIPAVNEPPSDPTFLLCGNPDVAVANLNCRATADSWDIVRQLNPSSGRLLPDGSLFYVDCSDKPNLDYYSVDDDDPCSPGSLYTIYVFWPLSNGREEAGQTTSTGANRNSLNLRCVTLLTAETLNPANYGCVIMDLVP